MDETKEYTPVENEVVSWYVSPQGKEVVETYVHRDAMPTAVTPITTHTAMKLQKKRMRWIVPGVAATLVLAAVVLSVIFWPRTTVDVAPDDSTEETESGEDASSIVDITTGDRISLPRYNAKGEFQMELSSGEELPTLTPQEVYAAVNPSTVLVVCRKQMSSSVGTGVILSQDGYILTNAHVIDEASDCWIALDTGDTYDCRLVGYDADEDVAILHAVDAAGLTPAQIGDSEECVVGDTVYAIGNPLGIELRGTLTQGLLSAINRDVAVGERTLTLLQTTAALNNGNSGGPLINDRGQVIGINTLKMGNAQQIMEGSATVEGLGFALPARSILRVVNDILMYGEYNGTPTIGITVQNTKPGELTVLFVEETFADTAEKILPGDVILKADGKTLTTAADLLAIRDAHVVGDTIVLTVRRGGETFDVEVTLYSSKDLNQ